MLVDDIVTGTGYPFQFPDKLHCRTLLVFTYRDSSELCRAVAAAAPRRGRRPVTFDGEELILTRSIVDDILDYQT